MVKVLKNKGSKVFKFDEGYLWDGDEYIIEWIMDKLGVDIGDNIRIKKKTYLTINVEQEIKK